MSICTERGRHGATVEAAPLFMDDDTVNVQHVCIDCELTVATTSWTREAWDEAHPPDRSAGEQQPSLF